MVPRLAPIATNHSSFHIRQIAMKIEFRANNVFTTICISWELLNCINLKVFISRASIIFRLSSLKWKYISCGSICLQSHSAKQIAAIPLSLSLKVYEVSAACNSKFGFFGCLTLAAWGNFSQEMKSEKPVLVEEELSKQSS